MMRLRIKKKTFLKTKISKNKKLKIKQKKIKLRSYNNMRKKLLSRKSCQMIQRMLLKNQMQRLINRKREVGVMVVDIVVEEEVGAGLTIMKEAGDLEDTPANSVIKTKVDKIRTSRTEEEAGVEVEVVEVIHSSETKINNKTKIVIFQVLKL